MQKLVKQGKDSAAIYQGQGRADLAEAELAQVAVLEAYPVSYTHLLSVIWPPHTVLPI